MSAEEKNPQTTDPASQESESSESVQNPSEVQPSGAEAPQEGQAPTEEQPSAEGQEPTQTQPPDEAPPQQLRADEQPVAEEKAPAEEQVQAEESAQAGQQAQAEEQAQADEPAPAGEPAQTGEQAQAKEQAPAGEPAQTGEQAQAEEQAPAGEPAQTGEQAQAEAQAPAEEQAQVAELAQDGEHAQTEEQPQAEAEDELAQIDVDVTDELVDSPPPQVTLAPDAAGPGQELPMPGGAGSQPAPFDPREAPVWQGLLSEYEREMKSIGEVPAAGILHYESGRIWEDKLAQPRNAWQSYNHAFQLVPQMMPNIRAARRLASQVGNWNVTVQIIDSEIEATPDQKQKAYLMLTRGLVLEDKLGKQDEARQSYQNALELVPDSIEALRELERIAITSGDWQSVIEVRAKLLEIIPESDTAIQLLLSSAQIHQTRLDDQQKAEELFEKVLERDPDNRLALAALNKIYYQTKRNEKNLDMLFRLARLSDDHSQATSLYYRAARIQREELGNLEHAIETLHKASELSPNDHMVLGEMAQLFESLMRWQELVDIYERQVEVITDRRELVSLYFKLGNIWEEKLFNEDKAIPNYRKVVELDPNYLPALQALGKLFYRKGQWDDLVQMYEVEIRETDDDRQRSVKLYKLAEILEERLSRDEEAVQKFEQCLELNPGYLPALKALGRLYVKYNRWESLIQMYENELAVTNDHDQAVFLLDKIAGIWEEKLNNVDKAIATQQRILERAPNYLPAIRSLGKLYVRADSWEELIRINELESQLINDQKQVISLLHRNGEICEEKLNDKDRAIDIYREVLALQPAYLPALQSLGRLYFIKGMWDELIGMYRQEIDVTSNEAQQITLLYKIGELYEDKLTLEDQALESYREVLEIQAGNFPALKALIRIFSAKRDWENLLEVLEQEASVIDDPHQKALSLYKMSEIWENQLSQPEKAIEILQRILDVVDNHPPTMQALRRLFAAGENWRDLLAVFQRELASATSDGRKVDILFAMAKIQGNELNDLALAAETHERILMIDPDHMPSLEALERIYLAQRNNNSLVKVYETLAQKTVNPQLIISINGQIADLKENRLQPPQNAGEHYLRVLAQDPNHPEARRALDILYHKFGTWHGLRMLYEQELAQVASTDEALDLCMRIADLAETRLDQMDVAIHYFNEALKIAPDHLPAIKALKRIYSGQENSRALLELLQAEGQVTRDPVQGIATLHEAGRLYREQFDDPNRAIECFFKILERDPAEALAFAQLEELLEAQQDWERLSLLYRNRLEITEDSRALADMHHKLGVLLLEKLQRAQDAAASFREVLNINPAQIESVAALASITFDTGQWDESVQYSGRILELSDQDELLKATNYRLGVIYQEKKPDMDRAVAHLDKVVEFDPADVDSLQRLRVIHSARQRWQEAIAVLIRLEEADPANRVDHMQEQANIFEKGLNEPDKAVEALQKVQQLDPGNATVIQKQGELYERLERWSDLVETYHAFIRLLPPDRRTDSIPLHMKNGQLYAEKLDNTDKAIIEYKAIVELDSGNVDAHVALAALYGQTGLYYANAIDEHRQLLEVDPFRLDSYHELRRIFEEQRAFDKVFCACAVMHYLRTADQNEEFFYGENNSKAPDKSSESLTPEELERMCVHVKERGIVRKIMKILGPALYKIFPADLASHGVGKGDKARPDDPLRTLANQMVHNMGGVTFELYRSSQPTHIVSIENTNPQGIVVGEGLVKRTQVKEQRFALGRALKRIMDGSFLATKLGPQQLSQLIAAAVHPYHPSSPIATYPSSMPEGWLKKINKALPRKSRKALEELLKKNASELTRVPDYESYLLGVEHSAIRVGLALSNDLANAIMHLSREIPTLDGKRFNSSDEIIAALANHPTLCELLRFAVSEHYFTLRTRLKMSIMN